MFKNKVILITGGTGFLGRSLISKILPQKPHSIRVFSRDEVKHHKLQQIFKSSKIRNLIGDIRDYSRIKKALKGVDYVIHAAALKRIDILEYNVEEVIKTNILGTLNLVNACLEENVKKAIFISTDKACFPVNTYGATKFIGEKIFTETNYNKGSNPCIFTSVRYGNVLDSTGSVIPFFTQKIKKEEPIPLTNEEMTRFIISDEQAVNLIFKAIKYAVGGEVFVPKLPSFRISDLIKVLTKHYDKYPPIKTIGIRPGEKIHELMLNEYEIDRTYQFKNLYVISSLLGKYRTLATQPNYIKEGKALAKNTTINELNSKDFLVSLKKLEALLIKLGVLTK